MKIEYSKEKLENVVINSNTYRQVLLAIILLENGLKNMG